MSAHARAGTMTLRSASVEDTEHHGEALAAHLEAGDVVTLSGPLGAGKTRFVAGVARGLDVAARVRSPSFALIHEYHGRVLLVHVDLYRLEAVESAGLGLDEQLERGVLVVEWGEKLDRRFTDEALHIDIEPADPDRRALHVRAEHGRGLELLDAWRDRAGVS